MFFFPTNSIFTSNTENPQEILLSVQEKNIAIETSEQSMLKELSLQDLENGTFIYNKVQLPDILSSWWIIF